MLIKRIYNNNVVVSFESFKDNEVIVIGRGIAFQKKVGDEINTTKVEKIFTLKDKAVISKLEQLLKKIPMVYLKISEEIIEMIYEESDIKLDENIYITLSDHISLSIERERDNIICENPLLIEIKQFYKKEFELAIKAAEIIDYHMNVKLSEGEIGFITLHIVNASMFQRANQTLDSINIVRDILMIIKEFIKKEFDENSLYYERIVRHLQFLAKRIVHKEINHDLDEYFYISNKQRFLEINECTLRIYDYILDKYNIKISNSELGYLLYHIKLIMPE